MNQIRSFLARYLFPLLMIGLGIALLIVSIDQNSLFVIGGISILGVGVISWLFIAGVINRVVQLALMVVLIGVAGYLIYMDYKVVDNEIEYQKKKDRIADRVIQRLKDIRTAQIAYEKAHDKYTDSFDSLITFLKEGQMPIVKSIGTFPDSLPTLEMAREAGIVQFDMPEGMTEEEAAEQGLIIRDTIYVSVLENTFYSEDALEDRDFEFHVDSLPYVPHSGVKFEMAAGQINVGGVQKPVFKVIDPKPFAKQYMVGSLEEATTSGNWNE